MLFVLLVDWIGLRYARLISVEFVVLVVAFTAVSFDMVAELRGRWLLGPSEAVGTLSSLHDVDRSEDILRAAEIPTLLSGAFHRALPHFMGRYIPVTFLVPVSSVAKAKSLLTAKGLPTTEDSISASTVPTPSKT